MIKTCPAYKLKHGLVTRMHAMLNRCGHKKRFKTIDALGCTIEEFKAWLESNFKPGMKFIPRNFEIDHVFPIALCGKDKDLIRRAFHYSNMMPLWPRENLEKSDTLTGWGIVSATRLGIPIPVCALL